MCGGGGGVWLEGCARVGPWARGKSLQPRHLRCLGLFSPHVKLNQISVKLRSNWAPRAEAQCPTRPPVSKGHRFLHRQNRFLMPFILPPPKNRSPLVGKNVWPCVWREGGDNQNTILVWKIIWRRRGREGASGAARALKTLR